MGPSPLGGEGGRRSRPGEGVDRRAPSIAARTPPGSSSTARSPTSASPMDILKSGTRKEELLVQKAELQKVFVLRRIPDGHRRRHRVPPRQAQADQVERRLLRVDEHVTS
jgi:hypothetical protein